METYTQAQGAVSGISIASVLLSSIISAVVMFLPVHLAVTLLKGETTLKKSFIVILVVNLVNGIIGLVLLPFLPIPFLSGIIGFVITTVAYMFSFKLSIIRAVLVGIIATILVVVIGILFGLLLGGLVLFV